LELAQQFLADGRTLTPERADDLAQAIQNTIEDWFMLNGQGDDE
jgi:hypothetical protein